MTNFDIADDAESKSITLHGEDATLYWGRGPKLRGRNRYKSCHHPSQRRNRLDYLLLELRALAGRACLRRGTGQNHINKLRRSELNGTT